MATFGFGNLAGFLPTEQQQTEESQREQRLIEILDEMQRIQSQPTQAEVPDAPGNISSLVAGIIDAFSGEAAAKAPFGGVSPTNFASQIRALQEQRDRILQANRIEQQEASKGARVERLKSEAGLVREKQQRQQSIEDRDEQRAFQERREAERIERERIERRDDIEFQRVSAIEEAAADTPGVDISDLDLSVRADQLIARRRIAQARSAAKNRVVDEAQEERLDAYFRGTISPTLDSLQEDLSKIKTQEQKDAFLAQTRSDLLRNLDLMRLRGSAKDEAIELIERRILSVIEAHPVQQAQPAGGGSSVVESLTAPIFGEGGAELAGEAATLADVVARGLPAVVGGAAAENIPRNVPGVRGIADIIGILSAATPTVR